MYVIFSSLGGRFPVLGADGSPVVFQSLSAAENWIKSEGMDRNKVHPHCLI